MYLLNKTVSGDGTNNEKVLLENRCAQRIQRLADWIKNNPGKMPNKHSENREERSLGSWIADVRCGKVKGITDEEKVQLKALGVSLENQLEQIASRRIQRLEDWIKNNPGKMPNKCSENKEERSLGSWISDVRYGRIKGITDEEKAQLKALGVSLENQLEQIASRWIQRLEDWLKDNPGKMPNKHSENKEERSLGFWIADVRYEKIKSITDAERSELIALGASLEKQQNRKNNDAEFAGNDGLIKLTATNHTAFSRKAKVQLSAHTQKLFAPSPMKTLLYSSQLTSRVERGSPVAVSLDETPTLKRPEYIIQAGLLLDTFLDTNLLSMIGATVDNRTVSQALPADTSVYGGSLHGKYERLLKYLREEVAFADVNQQTILEKVIIPAVQNISVPETDDAVTKTQAEEIIEKLSMLNLRVNQHLNVFALNNIENIVIKQTILDMVHIANENIKSLDVAKLIMDEVVLMIWLANKVKNDIGLLGRLEDYCVLYFSPLRQLSSSSWKRAQVERRVPYLQTIVDELL